MTPTDWKPQVPDLPGFRVVAPKWRHLPSWYHRGALLVAFLGWAACWIGVALLLAHSAA